MAHREDETGTTSACAENTAAARVRSWPRWNYLRMRGEYAEQAAQHATAAELPPHARRIPAFRPLFGPERVNYLRMRGEYLSRRRWGFARVELPPHARRILPHGYTLVWRVGTTSACAENTRNKIQYQPTGGNYLRMRGEYPALRRPRKIILELPPHARRIPAWAGGQNQ